MSNFFQSDFFVDFAYICASILFIFGLRMLGNPERAQRGNLISSLGMLLAIVVTLLDQSIISYQFLSIALIAGAVVGASAASMVKMTT
ncbi:NAD(P)(+) transhydrogenase (Re/Si-specific) subunit beta, partial [SAR86 cluster bacterium]|nr:NAD(P)(+) transhydrogenase (Re/Si-specific) subunit beta [SAR86 cluster bacterium]